MIYSSVTIILIIILAIIFYLIFSENFENTYLDQYKIEENNEIEIPEYVFIIVRHVNSELTNKYWKESYNCIRKFYPEIKVVIIDDSTNLIGRCQGHLLIPVCYIFEMHIDLQR